jgi:hypothetical protein
MHIHRFAILARFFLLIVVTLLVACTDNSSGGPAASNDNAKIDNSRPRSVAPCTVCSGSTDCPRGMACGQFGGDGYCVAACDQSGGCFGSDSACASILSQEGDQLDLCVPTIDICGDPTFQPTARKKDAGVVDSGVNCSALADPNTPANCSSCGTTHTCQANGCYGGWWCNTNTDRCQAPPTSCGASDAGTGGQDATTGGQDATTGGQDATTGGQDAGTGNGGSVGVNGGTLDTLSFAIVGDTRPPAINDTTGYPTAIITRIFQDIEAENPRPAFGVSTGDYQFSSATGSESGPQLQLYIQARSNFSNLMFPTMGNHECTGATASNCASTTTNNFDNYMSMILAPLQKNLPYYVINVNATDGSWTSKFVFVAANAWDSTQSSWLSSTLSQTTTYTFIVRHERSVTTTAPGVSPSQKIIEQNPYTALIVGHTHTYTTITNKQLVVGNGGAPVTGGVNYGYVIARQRSDGAIVFQEKDYQSGAVNDTFALNADGTVTQ